MTSAVRLDDVSVVLGRREVVRHVSLDVAAGSWTTIVGPNGAGKTTLLRAAAGLIGHTGTVLLDGTDLHAIDRRQVARKIAVMPQQPVVPPAITVLDYVLLGRTPYLGRRLALSARDIDVARGVLDRLELTTFAGRYAGELSGGELQRVVVARALTQEPEVLLLDEPTTGLDIGHQHEVLELVDTQRASGLTVLATMHDLGLAGQYSTHMLMLVEGRVVGAGPPAELLTADMLTSVYGPSVRVVHDHGDIVVIPRRSSQGRVH